MHHAILRLSGTPSRALALHLGVPVQTVERIRREADLDPRDGAPRTIRTLTLDPGGIPKPQ